MAEGAETLRSRLYRLQAINGDETWVERGEGYPQFKREDSLFRLRFFGVPGREVLYEVIVDTNIQFERAQNGVQWTQVKENEVMALSFKQQFSANAFWQLIEEYQRKYAISVPAAEGIYFYFEYKVPDPSPQNLNLVLQELENIPEKERHERVASIFLTKRDLLPRLLGVFRRVEESAEEAKLEQLFQILRIVFNASNEELFYELLCNESFSGVLGILEYDPNFRGRRPHHREFMGGQCRLLEVVPFKSNPELLNLVVFTYRLEYVRECVLFPYLDDNGFGSSGCIIRNNYKKIFNQLFHPKKKEFINSLYDLLRIQDLAAFKLLRELFRIARIHYMPEIYQQIAERDTFEIFIKNLRDLLAPSESQGQANGRKKKRKPEELEQIVQACLEILEQYMEHEPQHFRNFLSSEGEKVAKYPSCEFLLEQFELSLPHISQKLSYIIKTLLGTDIHPLKEAFKRRIIDKFLEKITDQAVIKWLPLFSQVLLPVSLDISERLGEFTVALLRGMGLGSKGQQIQHIAIFKSFMHNYFTDPTQMEQFLEPQVETFAGLLRSNRGSDGIRVSAMLALFVPPSYHGLAQKVAKLMSERKEEGLACRYVAMLERISVRKEVVLPTTLKRDCSDRALDEENFEKLSKKIKID